MTLRHVPGELSVLKLGLLTVAFLVFGLAILASLPIGANPDSDGDVMRRQIDQSHQALVQVESRLAQIEQQVSGDGRRIQQLELAAKEIRDIVATLKTATTPRRPTR
jgi:hypothetical protein